MFSEISYEFLRFLLKFYDLLSNLTISYDFLMNSYDFKEFI